jgi:hypothetical protein
MEQQSDAVCLEQLDADRDHPVQDVRDVVVVDEVVAQRQEQLREQAQPAEAWVRYMDYFVIDGHAWHTLIWCANTLTKRITSYSLGAVGAQSDVPGLFYDGVSGSGFYNVGWEVRSYVQYKWHVGWGIVFEDYACSQIRGGATGLYSYRNTCNLG